MHPAKRLYGTATVGTKGQIVIPADARDELDIKSGDRLYIIGSPGAGMAAFIKEQQIEQFIEHLSINLEELKHIKNKQSRKD